MLTREQLIEELNNVWKGEPIDLIVATYDELIDLSEKLSNVQKYFKSLGDAPRSFTRQEIRDIKSMLK